MSATSVCGSHHQIEMNIFEFIIKFKVSENSLKLWLRSQFNELFGSQNKVPNLDEYPDLYVIVEDESYASIDVTKSQISEVCGFWDSNLYPRVDEFAHDLIVDAQYLYKSL
ncbi:hypothetical protein TVAG_329210 [Trichomonas vaginalis G3]|uniref:Uncharacterized protein n=1 Tax=Trichomonas vaginalis (strain ATCC PRA-98 / G3) TaxID=412133 RepID=A2EB89_TRIV3|nr:hypothetical protein TVAGG3_0309940 [Trichomonas vaginalis G3]XP_001322257.1 hypothetical protein TVAGG3_0309860 [Trichomonas vaginalis G3]EAX66959.1 hypothetical protein TVAG_550900 [Trichomonas vaginalis G3]EAX72128.1 hypothetical protein TVAG_605650 [Trichomonas vaginalis G3]EAY10034.1 hypothetical protein TVAG_329210 [Trichomonas vaginalis G3]KAI5528515.1 hypothetical protein TVAGG3_0309860 [Trichomonas vaginalis G3]KAI5528523.1 hypothetical protein TVAGG3_0309940 [Trichomonas vaginali|eukprot:XP_001279889.1 hypothetical protein [Trichomonas vaginalis G3]